jgi:hypothetical protein
MRRGGQIAMALKPPAPTAVSRLAHDLIRSTIKSVAIRLHTFTSEDVMDALPDGTKQQLELHPNALGSAIRSAAREGLIADTKTMAQAKHAAAHSRKITVWRMK